MQSLKYAASLSLTLALCALFLTPLTQGQTQRTQNKEIASNAYAPQLYADRIKIKMTLINLPGANDAGSTWEASYQIFFISEENRRKAFSHAPNGGWNPTPEDFPGRVLLDEGTLKRTSLHTLAERTFLSRDIRLKAKVPDKSRTKSALILTSYSVKIFDARLKSNIYRSGIFAAPPFTDDQGSEAARTMLYASFYVSPGGQLFYSQRPRNSQSTEWQ